MIAELLNRDFVLQQLDDLNQMLTAAPATDENVAIARLAREIRDGEEREPSGQEGFTPPESGRRGIRADWLPLDDVSFFSRAPLVSLFQSVLDEYFETQTGLVQEVRSTGGGVGRRGPEDDPVTDRTLNAAPRRTPPPGRRLFERFSITDAQWVRSKIAEGVTLLRKPHLFNKTPAAPVTIADRARLLLVGDWATGVPRARKVAKLMADELARGEAAGLEQHVIHLGDVYYSGWAHEVRNRFLRHWPVAEGSRVGSWAVNANHDMFSGGYGYYDALLGDPRFARQQRSSFFSLVNRNWKILGLDTAFDDHGLKDPQAAWLTSEINEGGRKTLLLSHHQLFSPYEKVPDASKPEGLTAKIMPVLARKPVTAWFWGHEHRCVCLKPTDGVTFPRCLGHGGVPVYMTHGNGALPPTVEYEERNYISKWLGVEKWALFGFAVLDLDGDKISVRYIDENGNEPRSEVLG
jgi:hypothetical protein